jgi:hypothetical protein
MNEDLSIKINTNLNHKKNKTKKILTFDVESYQLNPISLHHNCNPEMI